MAITLKKRRRKKKRRKKRKEERKNKLFKKQTKNTPKKHTRSFPCSTDGCKARPHLCADTSNRGPNGHMSIKRIFTCQSDNLVYAVYI